MRIKAEITVFLSLILTSVCALIVATINSAKFQSMKMQAEGISDVALRSCFSEYNIDLFNRYDLLFVDTTYHGALGGDQDFISHIKEYINASIGSEEGDNIVRFSLKNISINESIYASDNDYLALKNQIIDIEKNKGVDLSEEELIRAYYEEYCEVEPDILQEQILNNIVEQIEEYMRISSNPEFDFDYLLEYIEVKFTYESRYINEYEVIQEFELK